MTVENNLRLADLLFEAFNDHDLKRMNEFITESCVGYQPSRTEPLRGRAVILEDLGFKGPFPDGRGNTP